MRHGSKRYRIPGRSREDKKALVRDMVSALLHHELIVTTHRRAKFTAWNANKVITKAKRGTQEQRNKVQGILRRPHELPFKAMENSPTSPPTAPLGYPNIPIGAEPGSYQIPSSLFPKLYTTLRERYANRVGGYTRVLKYDRRAGDKAPMAVVCLVDGPRDIKFELLARSVGKQAIAKQRPGAQDVLKGGWADWSKTLKPSLVADVNKMLKYRVRGLEEFEEKARNYADEIVAESHVLQTFRQPNPALEDMPRSDARRSKDALVGFRPLAGQKLSGVTTNISGLGLARGALGPRPAKSLATTMKWLIQPAKPASVGGGV